MMLKLVVSDFDGTLLPYGCSKVSKESIQYIKDLLSKGISFAIASGRTYSELSALLHEVADHIYFICDDGAVTVKNNKIVFKKQFSYSAIKNFFDFDIYKNVTMYSLDRAYLIGINNEPVLYGKTPCRVTRPFEIADDIFKITANVKRFDLVDTKEYRVHYSDGYFAEFVSPYANKGSALANLQLKLGITKFDTFAIGDADNDIPMVAHATRSWAVGNKSPKLVSISSHTATSAEEAFCKIFKSINKTT